MVGQGHFILVQAASLGRPAKRASRHCSSAPPCSTGFAVSSPSTFYGSRSSPPGAKRAPSARRLSLNSQVSFLGGGVLSYVLTDAEGRIELSG